MSMNEPENLLPEDTETPDEPAFVVDPANPDSEVASSGEIPWDLGNLSAPRGPVTLSDGRVCVGRVGAPVQQEATSTKFCFWIPEDALVEATQIVTTRSRVAGQEITYYALVDEVHRSSRRRGMGHEVDEYDGDLAVEPLYGPDGITYATAAILRAGTMVEGTEQPILTPPRERSQVTIASEAESRTAYGTPEMGNPMDVGLIKNGGSAIAGTGSIDLDYLLGENGGHLNVNGAAGRGTKSSFLLYMVYLLLKRARREAEAGPSAEGRLRIVPIVFNVKGYDLFHIDRLSSRFDPARHTADWVRLGIDNPSPFQNTPLDAQGNPLNPLGVRFFAAQELDANVAIPVQGRDNVRPYSWGLEDLVERGLFSFLFASDEGMNDNFQALLLDLEDYLTIETINGANQRVRQFNSQATDGNGNLLNTFDRLSDWVSDPDNVKDVLPAGHAVPTVKKLSRRLRLLTLDSRGVLRRDMAHGYPLNVVQGETCGPIVIDLNFLAGALWLQRFVVATVLRQLVATQTYSAVQGLKYLVVIDELNRFAPRGSRDPITKLVEQVAAEMRSQGILLFGAQQQASQVSERVIGNAGIRALGKTGMLELSNPEWRSLSQSTKLRADALPPNEKLLLQDTFRQPMNVRIPFPAWAMRQGEAIIGGPDTDGEAPHTANLDF